jgi:hypothetical protein
VSNDVLSRALNEAKVGMERLRETVLHTQLHTVLDALLEAREWDMLILEGQPVEDRGWFVQKLTDVAIPALMSETATAYRHHGLPQDRAFEDLFTDAVFDAALDAAAVVLERAGNAMRAEVALHRITSAVN